MNIAVFIIITICLIFVILTKESITILYGVRGKKSGQFEYVNKTFLYSITPILNIVIFIIIWIKNPYNKEYIYDRGCYKVINKMYKIYKNYYTNTFCNLGYCFCLYKMGYKSKIHKVLNFIKKYTGFKPQNNYWFDSGLVKPRIKLLNDCINNYKQYYKLN